MFYAPVKQEGTDQDLMKPQSKTTILRFFAYALLTVSLVASGYVLGSSKFSLKSGAITFGKDLILPGALLILIISLYILLRLLRRQERLTLEASHYQKLTGRLEQLVSSLKDQNKFQEAEILQLKGKIKDLETVTLDWNDRSIEVFRMIERVVKGEDLDQGYRLAMTRTKDHFAKLVFPLGVQVLDPSGGDPFDDKLHQIVGEIEDSTQPPWTIIECVEWGYLVGGEVETPAKVVISRKL